MDDFLYNLRKESEKRNRLKSGQQQYRGPDRHGPKDQRRPYPNRYDKFDQSSEIKTVLEAISENQKQLIENDNRKIRALEDIAEALQSLIGNASSAENKKAERVPELDEAAETETLQVTANTPKVSREAPELIADAAETVRENAPPVEAEADQSPEKPLRSTHEEIRKISMSLREQGKTYKEIAQYLDDQKTPTFSGKGGWHAPTIHKVCK